MFAPAEAPERNTISTPRVHPVLRLLLLIIIAILALILIWLNVMSWRADKPAMPGVSAGQMPWEEALVWRAADGAFPGGWGWGQLRFTADYLELTPQSEPTAACIFPVEHAADFVLDAEVMMLPAPAGTPTRLHLMTRDRGAANNVSGCVLTVDSDTLFVHHRVNATEHILTRVPTPVSMDASRWHRLRFTCAGGTISILLDGEEVFAAAGPFPPGLYAEPYVATEGGTVRLREFRVLAGPWEGK